MSGLCGLSDRLGHLFLKGDRYGLLAAVAQDGQFDRFARLVLGDLGGKRRGARHLGAVNREDSVPDLQPRPFSGGTAVDTGEVDAVLRHPVVKGVSMK